MSVQSMTIVQFIEFIFDKYHYTNCKNALFDACMNNDIETIRYLIDHQIVSRDDIIMHNRLALRIACQRGNIDVLKLLFDCGIIYQDIADDELYKIAVHNGHSDIADYITHTKYFAMMIDYVKMEKLPLRSNMTRVKQCIDRGVYFATILHRNAIRSDLMCGKRPTCTRNYLFEIINNFYKSLYPSILKFLQVTTETDDLMESVNTDIFKASMNDLKVNQFTIFPSAKDFDSVERAMARDFEMEKTQIDDSAIDDSAIDSVLVTPVDIPIVDSSSFV